MPDNTKPAYEKWPDGVTYVHVVNYALEKASRAISGIGLADLQHNEAAMIECVKSMRQIATRIDAFRRIRARQWAAASAANSAKGSEDA